jgi:hypothetical protein
MLHAICPNDPAPEAARNPASDQRADHKTFRTVASVLEDWVVDPEGNWLETLSSLDVVHEPDPGNIWECLTCGAEAKVE